jgi:hypothetical protein
MIWVQTPQLNTEVPVRSFRRGVMESSRLRSEQRTPYEAPRLKEYGDLGALTLGNAGTKMDNTGMGVFATKS